MSGFSVTVSPRQKSTVSGPVPLPGKARATLNGLACKNFEIHSNKLEKIPCANQDCNETFRKPQELVEHNVRHKEQGTALKKFPRPTAPQQLLPLPELVQDIPAWATLAPTVWIPRIPRERRKTLSTWVTPPSQRLLHYPDADRRSDANTRLEVAPVSSPEWDSLNLEYPLGVTNQIYTTAPPPSPEWDGLQLEYPPEVSRSD
ncbi:hypothetical protein B0H14DRAFT_2582475 [Mycena olivaceomarginata]|nr:hypothetical protein B0H14DRAFT_2582475 [Mycena olivaceomarginata]